jgi:hypothetical protein
MVLSIGAVACGTPERTNNPPPPDPVPRTDPPTPKGNIAEVTPPPAPEVPTHTMNPPPPEPSPSALPTWDQVESTHPKGATNPPRPVLNAVEDGSACSKTWESPMIPPEPIVRQIGGRVVPVGAELKGTLIQCPPQTAELLAKYKEVHQETPPINLNPPPTPR